MTEREEHKAKRSVERDLDEMQERSDRLGDDIDGTREDWERKKRDPKVPGAGGEDEAAGEAEDADRDGVPDGDKSR